MNRKKVTKIISKKVKKERKFKGARGKRKSKKCLEKSLRILGVNAAGLKPKMLTFKKVVSELKPAIVLLEETKLKHIGQIKVENFEMFELVRQAKGEEVD